MKVDKKKCFKLVVEQIENMLYNNKDYGTSGIAESFVEWCERWCNILYAQRY